MKIYLTGDQLQEAMTDYLVGPGAPSALLGRLIDATSNAANAFQEAGKLTDAAWMDAFVSRMKEYKARERQREEGFYLGTIPKPADYAEARDFVDLWVHQNPTVR